MASGSRDDDEDNNDDNDHDNDDGGGGNGESGERQWCVGMESHTPKRESRSSAEALACSPMGDTMLYPWNWSEEARNVNLSPGSSCSSPEYREHGAAGGRADSRSRSAGAEAHRRGRPRADALTNLMMQGSTSPSSIKCSYCSRVFPREKSLQAHLRTHTGTNGDRAIRANAGPRETSSARAGVGRPCESLFLRAGALFDSTNARKCRATVTRARARTRENTSVPPIAIMPRFKYLNGPVFG